MKKRCSMNINISKINLNPQKFPVAYRTITPPSFKANDDRKNIVPVYGDSPIRTNPAQLSLFALHDFHGQDIRMERAYSIIEEYDKKDYFGNNNFFDSAKPIDKIKLASGDMFLGENHKELAVVNEFLNIAGILANAVGNHECDYNIDKFAEIVKNRNYKFIAANMHPNKGNSMNDILSNSFIVESNGNKYGIIGLAPVDIEAHMKRPNEVKAFNVSDLDNTFEDLQKEIDKIKKQGVNKIILVSHLGLEHEQQIAQNISDIDVILGGHTHNLLKKVEKDNNLFFSPKGEPVLIMQVGRDGEYVGIPNLKFNELGQIEDIQYNIVRTEDYERSLVAKEAFERILGKPDVVGNIAYVEEPPKDIYAYENPHCDFILDCMRKEFDTDIAIMNSANIRGKFYKGKIDTRDLAQISPFGNKMTIIKVSEAELVESIDEMIEESMEKENHRPGILQVSGLRYEYSQSKGELTKLSLIDKNGQENEINIRNPRNNKFYTIAADDYCICSDKAGMDLKHRYEEAIQKFDYDKDKVIESYLRKHPEDVIIKSDGRIKAND